MDVLAALRGVRERHDGRRERARRSGHRRRRDAEALAERRCLPGDGRRGRGADGLHDDGLRPRLGRRAGERRWGGGHGGSHVPALPRPRGRRRRRDRPPSPRARGRAGCPRPPGRSAGPARRTRRRSSTSQRRRARRRRRSRAMRRSRARLRPRRWASAGRRGRSRAPAPWHRRGRRRGRRCPRWADCSSSPPARARCTSPTRSAGLEPRRCGTPRRRARPAGRRARGCGSGPRRTSRAGETRRVVQVVPNDGAEMSE